MVSILLHHYVFFVIFRQGYALRNLCLLTLSPVRKCQRFYIGTKEAQIEVTESAVDTTAITAFIDVSFKIIRATDTPVPAAHLNSKHLYSKKYP